MAKLEKKSEYNKSAVFFILFALNPTNGRNNISGDNCDKEAPIFGVSDLGIVGDCHKIVPLLTERLQKEIQKK